MGHEGRSNSGVKALPPGSASKLAGLALATGSLLILAYYGFVAVLATGAGLLPTDSISVILLASSVLVPGVALLAGIGLIAGRRLSRAVALVTQVAALGWVATGLVVAGQGFRGPDAPSLVLLATASVTLGLLLAERLIVRDGRS